jgi:hypothetical protein
MPNRGQADQLIAPLRPRLTRLRPPRPLRFARLLFLPLDPLIVPTPWWKQPQPAIPRTVIPVLAAAVERALGPMARSVASLIDGKTTQNAAVVAEAGALLWPRAAEILLDAPRPPDWSTTGLPPQMHGWMARRIGALLFQAETLRLLADDAACGFVAPESAVVKAMLADAVKYAADVQPLLIVLLFARIPDCGEVLTRVMASMDMAGGALLRHDREVAADMLLARLAEPGGVEAQLDGPNLSDAGAAVRRLMSLLGGPDADQGSTARRVRLAEVRQRISAGCEALFAERLSADLLNPLTSGSPGGGVEPNWELETAAQGLMALEAEARRIGGGKVYDALLGKAADVVREVTSQGGLGYAGGMRLMEILAGPEVALALFGEEA